MKIPATGNLTGRAVEEWIGKTPDTPVPERVKLRVFERYGGKCYLSGTKIWPTDAWQVEHIKPLKAGGENRENNLAPALPAHHKIKTADERSVTAKVDRTRKKHIGIAKSKAVMAGSRQSKWKRTMDGRTVER